MSEELVCMSCKEFEEILHDLDRPGASGLAVREGALAHAETCGRCGLLLIESESLDFALHTMSVKDEGRKASSHIETTLLREFRSQHSAPNFRVLRWQIALGAVAAVAVVALVMMRAQIASTPQRPITGGVTASTRAGAYNVVNDPQLAALMESEEGTAFVSLPYADDSASIEGGAVVRVTMPRSALVAFGLPVAGNAGSTDSISAEVVVSEDGTPQAIRLISEATPD